MKRTGFLPEEKEQFNSPQKNKYIFSEIYKIVLEAIFKFSIFDKFWENYVGCQILPNSAVKKRGEKTYLKCDVETADDVLLHISKREIYLG